MYDRPINVLLVEPDEEPVAEGGLEAVPLNLGFPDSRGVAASERADAFPPDAPVIVLTDEGANDSHRGPCRVSLSLGAPRQDAGGRPRFTELPGRADRAMHEGKRSRSVVLRGLA